MEEKTKKVAFDMSIGINQIKSPILWIGLLAAVHLAVLPMASTTALSNLTLALILLCLAWQFRRYPLTLPPWPLIAWAVYLCVFPFISDASDVAFKNLAGQWAKSLYAMLAGAGVAYFLTKSNRFSSLYLGMICSVILIIHLSLLVFKAWQTNSIPWGYWGIEVHHADLGYAAGSALILLTASFICGNSKAKWLSCLFGLIGFASMALAQSRAGLVFGFLGVIVLLVAVFLKKQQPLRKQLLIAFASFISLGLIALSISLSIDSRWQKIFPALEIGFYGQAMQLECEGLGSVQDQVRSKYGDSSLGDAAMENLRHADAQRIVLARAGLELAAQHPWGLDGSRQAFQKLLRQRCPNPVLQMAHTHNGWIDTLLAIGWVGAILYALVLFYFLNIGFLNLRSNNPLNEWALVLVALSIFWFLRGFTDSVFRDHMLQMQGFVLAFAAIAMQQQDKMTEA